MGEEGCDGEVQAPVGALHSRNPCRLRSSDNAVGWRAGGGRWFSRQKSRRSRRRTPRRALHHLNPESLNQPRLPPSSSTHSWPRGNFSYVSPAAQPWWRVFLFWFSLLRLILRLHVSLIPGLSPRESGLRQIQSSPSRDETWDIWTRPRKMITTPEPDVICWN